MELSALLSHQMVSYNQLIKCFSFAVVLASSSLGIPNFYSFLLFFPHP